MGDQATKDEGGESRMEPALAYEPPRLIPIGKVTDLLTGLTSGMFVMESVFDGMGWKA